MRYKGKFIGLNLKEERALIGLIIKAFTKYSSLTEEQQYTLKKSFEVITKNQEFTKKTFDQLLNVLYFVLYFKPIDFHRDAAGHKSGGWYTIPKGNPIFASKRLNNRLSKRRNYIDDAWENEFQESFDWEAAEIKKETKRNAKEVIKEILGPDGVKKISDSRDPRSAVIVPFKKPDPRP